MFSHQKGKYVGALIGLAVGDAIGTTLEFKRPGTFNPIDDMMGGGPFNLLPGQWTDDTSMALCLAESLVKSGGFDPKDQMDTYLRWYRKGHNSAKGYCFDIGTTTLDALSRYEEVGDPYSGSTNPYSAGNGSLMRLAPVPLFFANKPIEAIEKSGDSSRTTHGAKNAVDACRYFGGLIAAAVRGISKEELLSPRYAPVPDYWTKNKLEEEIDEVASGSFKKRQPPEIVGSGYVVKSLEAALWAFYRSNSFREGCLLAVNLGNDADTTGAIYGQLAGAYYGIEGIPKSWVEKLYLRDKIEELAENIFNFATKTA